MEINCKYCPKNDGIYCCGKIIPHETFYNPHNLEGEIWKPIIGYENLYHVSNYGRVKSLLGGNLKQSTVRILKNRVMKSGYHEVVLYKNKVGKPFKVHRLVATAFIPNAENKPCIDHIDTNRINNNVKNLRWVTIKENCNNSISLKKFRKRMLGENNPFYGKRLSDSHKKKMSLAKMGILNGNRSIPVIQINPHNGQKLKEYQSSAEAERNTGAKEPNILRCCKHNRPIAGGFAWAYKTEYDMCKDTSVYVRPIKYRSLLKPICQYTKEGILVNEYNSLKEASRVTGISKNNISRSAVKQKSLAGGYMWKYKIK